MTNKHTHPYHLFIAKSIATRIWMYGGSFEKAIKKTSMMKFLHHTTTEIKGQGFICKLRGAEQPQRSMVTHADQSISHPQLQWGHGYHYRNERSSDYSNHSNHRLSLHTEIPSAVMSVLQNRTKPIPQSQARFSLCTIPPEIIQSFLETGYFSQPSRRSESMFSAGRQPPKHSTQLSHKPPELSHV